MSLANSFRMRTSILHSECSAALRRPAQGTHSRRVRRPDSLIPAFIITWCRTLCYAPAVLLAEHMTDVRTAHKHFDATHDGVNCSSPKGAVTTYKETYSILLAQ
jgi:hypothetical protein